MNLNQSNNNQYVVSMNLKTTKRSYEQFEELKKILCSYEQSGQLKKILDDIFGNGKNGFGYSFSIEAHSLIFDEIAMEQE